jgi:2-aminoethylphosphonate-pyruvate transaminase
MAGISFAIATHRAIEDARRATPRSLVLNLVAEFDHLEKTGQMRFTCPPQVLSALQRALIEFEAEGLEARGARYAASMRTLVAGLRELGFEQLLEDRHQSGILVAIREPRAPWYDFKAMHDALFEEGFTIYPGKPGGAPTFRLAVLGDIDETDIENFLAALRRYLGTAMPS